MSIRESLVPVERLKLPGAGVRRLDVSAEQAASLPTTKKLKVAPREKVALTLSAKARTTRKRKVEIQAVIAVLARPIPLDTRSGSETSTIRVKAQKLAAMIAPRPANTPMSPGTPKAML